MFFCLGICVCKCRCNCGSTNSEDFCKCLKKAPECFHSIAVKIELRQKNKIEKMKLVPLSQIKRKLTYERKGGKKAPRQNDFTPKKLHVKKTEAATNTNEGFIKDNLLEKASVVRQLDKELSNPKCFRVEPALRKTIDQVMDSNPLILSMLNSLLFYN